MIDHNAQAPEAERYVPQEYPKMVHSTIEDRDLVVNDAAEEARHVGITPAAADAQAPAAAEREEPATMAERVRSLFRPSSAEIEEE